MRLSPVVRSTAPSRSCRSRHASSREKRGSDEQELRPRVRRRRAARRAVPRQAGAVRAPLQAGHRVAREHGPDEALEAADRPHQHRAARTRDRGGRGARERVMSETTESTERNARKVREGIVSATKMDKTAVVTVTDRVRHRRYNKTLQRHKKLYVHD